MKIYRFVIALLVLAALVIPQATPVQSAPLSAEKTINLRPGDTVTINCPTRLLPKSASNTKVKLLCRPIATTVTATAGVSATATATAVANTASTAATDATATATQPLAPTASQHVVDLNPLDVLTISCPTKLIQKSTSHTKWKLLCRPVPATQTPEPTATHLSEAIATHPSELTATQPSATNATQSLEPTATQPSVSTATQTSVSNATQSPQPTATHPMSMPTGTQMSMPTGTQMSMPTVVAPPLVTPTRGPNGLIQPYANAPACPSHNPNAWHGIWDYQRGCHYGHTHGDDPSLANSYFGTFGALWGGSTISYPFNSGPMENTMKHGGYKVSIRMPGYHPWPVCGLYDQTDLTGADSDNCVVASRVEYHLVGGLMDIIARYHSFFAEFYVCSGTSNYTQCGIVRTGGLLDYGELKAPHYGTRVVRPGGAIDFGDGMVMEYSADAPDLPSRSGEPYVFSRPYSEEALARYLRNPPGSNPGFTPGSIKATIDQWSTNDWDCEFKDLDGACHNLYTHFMFQVGDSWNLVDTQNLNTVHWICKDEPGCEYNGSLIGLNEIAVRVLQEWQPNGNGYVTLTGYTDKWGNPKTGCTSVTADCVPFVLERAPVGVAASKSGYGCLCDTWEYDVYFNGKPSGWIKHPN